MTNSVAELVREEAIAIVGADNVTDDQKTMGAEGLQRLPAQVPGAFAFVGAANTEKEVHLSAPPSEIQHRRGCHGDRQRAHAPRRPEAPARVLGFAEFPI